MYNNSHSLKHIAVISLALHLRI